MPDKDWRTDNWGGAHRQMYDKNYYHAPRTSREAGFYYGPERGPVKHLYWGLALAVVIIMGLIFIG